MQRVLLLLIVSFAVACVKAQDVIITTSDEEIPCKIIHVSPSHIYYEQVSERRTIIGRRIPLEEVKEYYFDVERRRNYDPPRQRAARNSFRPRFDGEPFRRWKTGVQGGGAYLTASSGSTVVAMQDMGMPQSQIDDYHKQLRNGLFTGADIHYLITRYFGAGLRYSLFTSSLRMDYLINDNSSPDFPSFYCVGEDLNIFVNYIGPSFMFHHWLDSRQRFSLSEELSFGYAYYKDKERFDPYQYVFYSPGGQLMYNVMSESHSWGAGLKAALEYYPSPVISISANAGFFYASFRKVKISMKDFSVTEKLESGDYLNMSRFDYSLGIRFHF